MTEVDRSGGGVGSGYIYNPVREKEHCGGVWRCWCRVSCPKPRLQSGRRNERAVLDFTPSPHRLHSLGSARVSLSEAMGLSLRNATRGKPDPRLACFEFVNSATTPLREMPPPFITTS